MMKRLALLVVALLAIGAAPAGAYPDWPGTPSTPAAPNTECREIIVTGDSIGDGIEQKLAQQFDNLDYCVTVRQESIPGSSTCQWLLYDWWDVALNRWPDADAVVAHFLPNPGGCKAYTDPTFLTTNRANTGLMQLDADARGLPLTWVVPAPSLLNGATACYTTAQSYGSNMLKYWAHDLEARFPDQLANLRPSFGHPGDDGWQQWFHFANETDAPVRTSVTDCVHMMSLGYAFAANVVRANLAPLWGS